ncbi:hypothetical protein GQX73_g7035 [Xylaria multiplex]|uniref:Uncharacterized protein n=1 Tax=Xylaria multiplex TaxID=323545 RepID=A0A7C8MJX3_9PEZI|nr:hypothetical protein GQX73_g7035 [Xylaria multiplex]
MDSTSIQATSSSHAAVSSSLTALDKLQTLYESWPEDRFYYSQLWNYLDTAGTEIPSLVSLGFRHAPPFPCRRDDESATNDANKVFNKQQLALEMLPQESEDGASNPSGRLVFLVTEGIPSPSTTKQLALDFQVRPELLIGHLEFDRAQNTLRASFELPAPTSRRSNLVHVRSYGSTRIRRVHVHDSQHFTIEQMASFCLLDEFPDGTQTSIGLFMLDKGAQSDATSWSSCLEGIDSGIPSIVPAVRYNEPLHQYSIPIQPTMASRIITHPFHPFRDCNTSEICQNLRNRPIVGLYTLLSSAVLSWNQVLNFIEDDIDENQDTHDDQDAMGALSQTLFNAKIIHRFETFIRRDLELLKNYCRNGSLEFRSSASSRDQPHGSLESLDTDPMIESLLEDYKSLVDKCELLIRRCESSRNVLQSAAQWNEAQRSMNQTTEINKLTRIVFIFAPLSFLASVFGMNVISVFSIQKYLDCKE